VRDNGTRLSAISTLTQPAVRDNGTRLSAISTLTYQ